MMTLQIKKQILLDRNLTLLDLEDELGLMKLLLQSDEQPFHWLLHLYLYGLATV